MNGSLAAKARYAEQVFEDSNRKPRFSVGAIMKSIQSFASLSELLRIAGAGVILASMSVYLLQGWHEGNDVSRYLLLLAETGLLAAAGLAMSHGLNEAKGARVFFGLALVSIPANFAILGALVYSALQWDGALVAYPAFATWRIDDLAVTGATIAGAIAVLLPVALFCFAIMARRSSRSLALNYVLLNALLLLPVRSSVIAGGVAVLGIAWAHSAVRRLQASDPALKTAEGRFALGTLYLPMGIMIARSLYFYDVDSLMVSMVATAVFLAVRQAAVFPDRHRRIAAALDAASLPVAAIASLSLADAVSPLLPNGLLPPLAAMAFAGFGVDVLRRTQSSWLQGVVTITVSLVLGAGFCLGVLIEPSGFNSILALVAGGSLVAASRWTGSRSALACGGITIATGLLFGLEPLFRLVMTSQWYALAVTGALTIALGSVLDRHGAALKLRTKRWLEPYRRKLVP